jgi:histidinol dehydrogenase
MKTVRSGEPAFEARLAELSSRGESDLTRVEPEVRAILERVRAGGDAALRELTQRFEGREVTRLVWSKEQIDVEARKLPLDAFEALREAAHRIERYHRHQLERGFDYEEDGIRLGLRVRAVRAAGVYAPGGKARYPSSVLMSAVPAKVAGVPRIVLATPRPTPELFAAASLSGVTELVDAGGAQAIGALAFGTESIAPVDKIVGPGNIYVACAKRLVFGHVGIDSIAGPSEILVLADAGANAKVVAADLLSQAEHDEDAYSLLVTDSQELASAVAHEVQLQLSTLPRRAVAEVSIQRHATTFVVSDLEEAARVASVLAAEHLSLQVRAPHVLLGHIESAGAVFIGDHTPEAAGDYAAGPSHVLPTGGAARYASPLGVWDFVKRTSLIEYGALSIAAQTPLLTSLARLEGLEAHARAVEARSKKV